MGLENPTFVNDLVEAWPLGTDFIRQGDDHLRAVKRALKNTFPNATEALTASMETLNAIPTDFAGFIAAIAANVVPKGTIVMWSGDIAHIPTGWALCDGGNGTPDLRDRFVIGAGNSHAPGSTGGSISKDTDAKGGHTPNIQGTSLSVDELPAHHHRYWASSQIDFGGASGSPIQTVGSGGTYVDNIPNGTAVPVDKQFIENTGSGNPHTHTADAVVDHTHTIADASPPFYALALIMKTVDFAA